MERLIRVALAALLGLGVLAAASHPATAGGEGAFGDLRATASFGDEMTFSATWDGPAVDAFELLLGFGGEDRLVVPAALTAGSLTYRRDMADNYLPPNTPVTYRWRAVDGATATVSPEQAILYDDDRLDWEQARIGSATVYWYGGNESIASRFGTLAGDAADRAADLLGHPLSDPLDMFVYDEREDFLEAIGPGQREWIGAATYPHIRTVFMWLGAGSTAFLETTVTHEVTHVVFADASDNPFHAPATWINEGVATWSELQSADAERDLVSLEADSDAGLFAFEALTDQFPIDSRGATLAYAQGSTMIGFIIDEHGRDAIAAMMAAFREGAGDAEAVEAGAGVPYDELTAAYFRSFGVDPPQAVVAVPLEDSDVPIPPQPDDGAEPSPAPSPEPSDRPTDSAPWVVLAIVVVGGALVGGFLVRRGYRRLPPPADPGS